MKKVLDTPELKALRIRVVFAVMAVALAAIIGMLWKIQISHGAEYESDFYRQSIRRVRLPGTRGKIVDRRGVPLAENRPSYCIAIYLEDIRQMASNRRTRVSTLVEDTLVQLSEVLKLPVEVSEEQIKSHVIRRSPLPLLAWRDIGEEAVARLVENPKHIHGADIYLEPVREYPHGSIAAHVIGYVGRADIKRDEDEERYHYYLPETEGRRGVERTHDAYLRGRSGGRLIRVDVMGFKYDLPGHREIVREPEVGSDVKLTLDLRIQRLTERALGTDVGAAVVMDVNNGDILAMVSRPTFDLNQFIPGITTANWAKLRDDPKSPLLNRVTAGAYAPGSLFKVVVAMAGLERTATIKSATSYQCPGYYALGKRQLKCWNWKYGGHGLISMHDAIVQSCNTYFCSLGADVGYRNINRAATELGYGRRTGVETDLERPGRLPSPDWIQSRGDLANISIGQGALDVTPLQVAVTVAAIANGGKVLRPRIVRGVRGIDERVYREFSPVIVNELGWKKRNLDIVRRAMLDAVATRRGTCKRARVEGLKIAGKSGTAEYGSRENRKKRAWMMAFVPFDKPKHAIVMALDDSVSGGISVAPRIGALIRGIYHGEEAGDERG